MQSVSGWIHRLNESYFSPEVGHPLTSGRPTSGLWLGWSGIGFKRDGIFLPSILGCGQCCGFRREGLDHFIWM